MSHRLLFLSHRLPYPPHSGAAIRTFHILRELAAGFAIEALCFDREDPALAATPLPDRLAGIAPWARCEAFPIPQQRSRARLLSDHLRSLVTGHPYTWYVHDSRPFERRVRERLAGSRYGVIHLDSFDLVRFLRFLPLERVAVTHHNVESELLHRRADQAGDPLRRAYVHLQGRLLRRAEQHWAPRVAVNLCTSPDDAALLQRIAPGARTAIVPNGVDDQYFRRPPGPRDGGLVFVGGTSWHPNRDALEWFASAILPALRAGGITAGAVWVGRITEEERQRHGQEGLELTGYVEDVRPYLARARCFVAPIRFGGGTRLKILDAWAMQVPVVGTRAAMEGLDVREGENCLLAETPADFVAQVRRVLDDPGLQEKLGMGGRRAVEAKYSWRGIGDQVRELYREIAAASAPSRRDS